MALVSLQNFVQSQAVNTFNGLGLNRMTALVTLALSPFVVSLYSRHSPPSDAKHPTKVRTVLLSGIIGTVGALDLLPYSRVVTAVAGAALSMLALYLRLDSN